jgi:hypothetical protein
MASTAISAATTAVRGTGEPAATLGEAAIGVAAVATAQPGAAVSASVQHIAENAKGNEDQGEPCPGDGLHPRSVTWRASGGLLLRGAHRISGQTTSG